MVFLSRHISGVLNLIDEDIGYVAVVVGFVEG
jgi:hypothetical protein